MNHATHDFWNFSVTLYSTEGVADACLSLQNDYHFDVNLVLFCFWHGHRFGEFPDGILEQAWKLSHDWRKQVVQPLRDCRTWMKAIQEDQERELREQFDKLRERIKTDELAAERLQQEYLERLVTADAVTRTERDKIHDGLLATRANLKNLCQQMLLTSNLDIEAQLQVLEQAVP